MYALSLKGWMPVKWDVGCQVTWMPALCSGVRKVCGLGID